MSWRKVDWRIVIIIITHFCSSSDEVVKGTCLGFFGAGSNTTRIAVEYLLQLCAAYPQLQEQLYQEIILNVGGSRLPCWSDKDNLHLVNAFIQERHRTFSIAPLGVFRKYATLREYIFNLLFFSNCGLLDYKYSYYIFFGYDRALRDTKIAGYDVPRGSVVIYNIDSVHQDSTLFTNPEQFNPGRFIDADGKFIPSNNVIPFAIGTFIIIITIIIKSVYLTIVSCGHVS